MADKANLTEVAQAVVQGAVKGGTKGALVGGARTALKGRWRTIMTVVALCVCLVGLLLGAGGEPTRLGMGHVQDVAVNGSGTSEFAGAAQESGLEEPAGEISEVSEAQGVPTVVLLALVSPSSGPWRADTDTQVVDNARTVAQALAQAKADVAAPAGWDLSTGTVMCQGDQLVVAGDPCPSGVVSDASGAQEARQVREAWVAAMMAVQGLPEPRTGTVSGAVDAPAAQALEGDGPEQITQVATGVYSLPETAVSVEETAGQDASSRLVTVTTDDPLPLATTLVTHYQGIGIASVEAAGRTWTPETGWTTIDAAVDGEDPTATRHVRVRVCGSGWGARCSTEPVIGALSREQADQVYSQALSWYLGTPTAPATCTPDSGGATVAQVTSATGESVTIGASQAAYVEAIITAGRSRGEPDSNVTIALMVALAESRLQMYANSTVPESLGIAHDAVGADHDSVGLFQQRPSQGWGGGDITTLMDAGQSAGLFYDALDAYQAAGGAGSYGEQAQAVQASAYPERFTYWEQAATTLLSTTAGSSCVGADVASAQGWGVPAARVPPDHLLLEPGQNAPGPGVRPPTLGH